MRAIFRNDVVLGAQTEREARGVYFWGASLNDACMSPSVVSRHLRSRSRRPRLIPYIAATTRNSSFLCQPTLLQQSTQGGSLSLYLSFYFSLYAVTFVLQPQGLTSLVKNVITKYSVLRIDMVRSSNTIPLCLGLGLCATSHFDP